MTSWVLSCNPVFRMTLYAYMSQWTTPEGEEPGKVHSQKVKVNYLPPDGHPLERSCKRTSFPESSTSDLPVAVVRHREGKTQYVWTSWRSVLGHP
jgi:hypothetical protein